MKEKNLTAKIFDKIRTPRELRLVCASFTWLIQNNFIEPDIILYTMADKAFRRIHNI